jgi:hypothetical protein
MRSCYIMLALCISGCGSNENTDRVVSYDGSKAVTTIHDGSQNNLIKADIARAQVGESTEKAVQIFSCYGLNLSDESFEIKIFDWSVGGDHLGPVGQYNVSGGRPFAQAKGDVRLSNDTYQFLSGKLGLLNAIIVPSNQGFWTFVVGSKGSQCSNQDTP